MQKKRHIRRVPGGGKSSMKAIKGVAVLIPVILLAVYVVAHGQQLRPPPEAYKVCEGKSKGSAAQFVGPRGGTVNGICEEVDGKLVLQPNALPGAGQKSMASGAVGPHFQSKEASPRTIELPVGSSKVFVTRAVPDAENERGLTDKDYKVKTVHAKDGKVVLTVDGIPIFVEEQEPTTRAESKPVKSPFGFHPAYTYDTKMDRKKLKEPSDVGYNYTHSADMGVVWNRPEYYALWGKIQKNDSDIREGRFDWKETDYVYGAVPKRMMTMGNIGGIDLRTKKGVKPYPRTFTFKSDFYEKSFPLFVKKLVERYDGNGVNDMPGLKNPVKYWQIDNEPNLGTKDWKGYSNLVEATGKAVKEVCPDCKVIMGGMTDPQSLDEFYVPVMRELKGKYVDIFDLHSFGLVGSWAGYKDSYESIKTALNANGFGNADVWITETGTFSGTPKISRMNLRDPSDYTQDRQRIAVQAAMPTQTEKQQAADVVKRYVYALSLGIKKIFWAFGIMEGFKGDDSIFDHTGFISEGKSSDYTDRQIKKLAYYSYKLMTEKLEGSDFSNIRRVELGEGVHAFKFLKSGRTIYVVWAY